MLPGWRYPASRSLPARCIRGHTIVWATRRRRSFAPTSSASICASTWRCWRWWRRRRVRVMGCGACVRDSNARGGRGRVGLAYANVSRDRAPPLLPCTRNHSVSPILACTRAHVQVQPGGLWQRPWVYRLSRCGIGGGPCQRVSERGCARYVSVCVAES